VKAKLPTTEDKLTATTGAHALQTGGLPTGSTLQT